MRTSAAGLAGVVALLVAVTAGGCGATLQNGVDRSEGVYGAGEVSPERRGPVEDVPVTGHQVTVYRFRPGADVSGELIAASESELVVEPVARRRERIPLSEVRSIAIDLYPSHGGSTALIALGAMTLGFVGVNLAVNNAGPAGNFLGGWGIVWIPAGLLIALPTALGVGLSNDYSASRDAEAFQKLVPHLHEFARYPQGEPGAPTPKSLSPSPPPQPYSPPPSEAPQPESPPPVTAPPVTAPPATASSAPSPSPQPSSTSDAHP